MSTTNTGQFGDGNRGVQVVSNTGSIVTHHHTHLAAGESASPLHPRSITLPRRVRDYVENRQATDRLEELVAGDATRVAVVGLGGIGKTQLAINYLHKIRQRDADVWTLWIFAGNAARFDETVGDVTKQLQLYDEHTNTNKLLLLQRWLQNTSRRWILILDNVDTASYLHEPPAGADSTQAKKHRIEYLPHCPHGTVIITSRNKEVARSFIESDEDMLEVEAMSLSDAKAYLQQKLTTRYTDDSAAQLAAALDCIPLALNHAASYIVQRRRITVESYLTLLETNQQARTTLMRQQVTRPARDRESCDSVAATWQISFEHINAEHKTAADMLALMSLCDRQSIPAFLLKGEPRRASDYSAASLLNIPFEDDMHILENYSFISPGNDEDTWTMHRLVQDSMLWWLQGHGREHENRQRFIAKLIQATPLYNRDNWPDYQILLPHIRSCDFMDALEREQALDFASVLQRMSCYSQDNCLYNDNIALTDSIWQAYKRWHGTRDMRTLKYQVALGLANLWNGSHDKAEGHLVFVVETLQEELGDDDDRTIEALAYLADLYDYRNDHEAAATIRERVLQATMRRYGLRSNRTMPKLLALAKSYAWTGSIIEAYKLCELVLVTRQEYLPGDLMHKVAEYSTIAVIYRAQHRHDDAIVLGQEALILANQVVAAGHVIVSHIHHKLGESFQALQDHEQAKEHLQKAVSGWKRTFGPANETTLLTMHSLANTYYALGSFQEAASIRDQVLNITVMALGHEHPLQLGAMLAMAESLDQQGSSAAADDMYRYLIETAIASGTHVTHRLIEQRICQTECPIGDDSSRDFQQSLELYAVQAFLKHAWQWNRTRNTRQAVFGGEHRPLAAPTMYLAPRLLAVLSRLYSSNDCPDCKTDTGGTESNGEKQDLAHEPCHCISTRVLNAIQHPRDNLAPACNPGPG